MVAFNITVQGDLGFLTSAADDKMLRGAVRDATEYVRGVWASAVSGAVLPGMRAAVNDDEYLRSLGLPTAISRTGDYAYTITADYEAAERIELGFGSYDMKPGLLHGPNARRAADGSRYNTIPFRFGTPIDSGPHKGEARPHFPGELTMPPEVYRKVKDGTPYPDSGYGQRSKVPLTFTETTLGGVNAEAILHDVPAPMSGPYTWQTGLYSGMPRVGRGNQTQYYTYRRVSEPRQVPQMRPDGRIVQGYVQKGSDPNSWIHPGQAPNPVIEAVVAYSRPQVEPFLERAVAGLVSARAARP